MNFLTRKNTAYKQAFNGPAGEFLLASILDFAGFYKQSFSSDPYQTAFNEGKRAVALHLIQILAMTEEDLRNLVRGYREEQYQSSNTGI
jgi:hypothetical protein